MTCDGLAEMWSLLPRRLPRCGYPVAILVGFHIAALAVSTFLPPSDYDTLHYHLNAPLRWIEAGRFVYLPSYTHTNWPLGSELLSGVGLSFDRHFASCTLFLGFTLLLSMTALCYGRLLKNVLTGQIAALLTLFFVVPFALGNYVEPVLAQYTLAALFVMHKTHENDFASRESRHLRLLSACFAGFAATTKLFVVITPVLIALVFCFSTEQNISKRERLSAACVYCGVAFCLVLPWYLRSFLQGGNPFYPMLWRFFPTRDWSAETAQRFDLFCHTTLTLPRFKLSASTISAIKGGCVVIIAAAGIIAARMAVFRSQRSSIFFVTIYVILLVGNIGTYVRYLIPVFAPIFLILVSSLLPDQPKKQVGFAFAFVMAILVIHPNSIRTDASRVALTTTYLTGRLSRDAYLSQKLPIYPMLQWADRNLPKDSGVAFCVWYDAFPTFLSRRSVHTNPWLQGAVRVDAWTPFVTDLKRFDITHFIVPTDDSFVSEEPQSTNTEFGFRARTEFRQFHRLRSKSEAIHAVGGFTLY